MQSRGRVFIWLGVLLAIISGLGVFLVLATAEPQPVSPNRQQISAVLAWFTPTPLGTFVPITQTPVQLGPSSTPEPTCLPRSASIDAPTHMNESESSTLAFTYEEGGRNSCEVHARLVAAAFDKDPSDEEIVLQVNPSETAVWKWVISPKKTGSQVLLVEARGPNIPAFIYSEFKIEVLGPLGIDSSQQQAAEVIGPVLGTVVIIIGVVWSGIQIYDRFRKSKEPRKDKEQNGDQNKIT